MFPSYSRQFYRPNQQVISRALEKSRKNELTVEDILDDEDLVNDLKSQSFSQLISCINQDKLKKLIDFISIEPTDEKNSKLGFKYPYYASEILSSENVFIIDKFFEEQEEPETRKNLETTSPQNRGSSIIEINLVEESNSEADNKEKSNSTKDNKLLNFFNDENDNTESNDKTDQNDTNNLENTTPTIIENMKGENMDIQDKPEESKSCNDHNKSSLLDEKRKIFSNLDYLFGFLSHKGQLNYVLCGYFYKVFNHLSNYKNAYLMRYLMEERPEVIFNMIKHLNRKSICDSIFKVLISFIPDFSDHDIKKEILNKIIISFRSDDAERANCISELLMEILANKRIYYLIVKNEDLLLNIHQLIINNINNPRVSKDLIKILIKLNENLLKDINGIATTSNAASNPDSQYILSNYLMMSNQGDDESSVMKSQNDNFDICNFSYIFITISKTVEAIANDFIDDSLENFIFTTYSQNKKVLGITRIVQFEYFYNILEIIVNANSNMSLSPNINLNNLIEKLIKSKIFKKAFQYFFEYPMNNMFQKIFNDSMVLISNKYTPEIIIKEIFVELDFFNKVVDFILNPANKIYFGHGRTINSGIFAIICDLTVFLSEAENIYIKQIFQKNSRLNEFVQFFAIKIKDKYTKGIQFQQENPFQKQTFMEKDKSNELAVNNHLKKEKSPSESFINIIEKCTENLSFHFKKINKNNNNDSTLSNTNQSDINLEENNSYYDNNYWCMNILEVALDDII